jgi:superfamily I DNA/RNA helicase
MNNPTGQQQAFLTALVNTTSNLALVARAGCGKTSTILLGVSAYRERFPTAEILVCAFNKAIASEVQAKLKAAGHSDWRLVQAATAHSLGWSLVRFVFRLGNEAIDGKKVANLIMAHEQFDPVFKEYRNQIRDLVGYAKQEGFGFFAAIADKSAWYKLADHYDINGLDDNSEMDRVVKAAQHIYQASLKQTDIVDFDDMILFPLVKNLVVKFQKDLVIVDEAQDLSPARQALIRKFVKPHGRMVAVGDDRQAIYGFAGADAEALPNLIRDLDATVLPLSVTWRCPKAVVARAQLLVPDIEAAPEAPEGEVIQADPAQLDQLIMSLGTEDAVLCRNTAPLIALAYQMIRAGKPCKVEGRSIGTGLVAMVRRWKVSTIDAFL